ncbi:hypothetical protein [Niastella sp. OAS944]|uniref:hypothetical protein n=1 Tax=Niastella sp. OAS944 TaxID=2664089 RepID=UPI00346E973D|nr:hypothetical protein [Chitinophagaceae bacterium OAS944]
MKSLLIAVCIICTLNVCGQCDQKTAFVFSLAPAYSKTGFVFNMEAGLWPVDGRVGVLAGPVLYSEQHLDAKGNTETVTDFDVAGRVVFKLTDLGNDSPQLITVYGTAHGNVGGSYRGYISIGRYDLLGIEPFYGTKTGMGVGLIFTTRL